jgi:hypothetical protein
LDSRVVFLRDNVKREASCMYYGCACARVRVDVRRVCGAISCSSLLSVPLYLG